MTALRRFSFALALLSAFAVATPAWAGTYRDGITHWGDCSGVGGCAESYPHENNSDLGLMLQAHGQSSWGGDTADFHLGVGVRPRVRIELEGSGGPAQLTSTVIPAELGMSLHLGSMLSLELVGQAETWLPWKYCDTECVGAEGVQTEVGWSVLTGLTLRID